MPLQQQTLDDFEPRLAHLMVEIKRVHQLRNDGASVLEGDHRKKLKPEVGTQLNIDSEAEDTLKDAVDFLIWKLGENLDIEKSHRQFLRLENLGLEDIYLILGAQVPEPIKAHCLTLLTHLTHSAFEVG